jgi:hypothetical protein
MILKLNNMRDNGAERTAEVTDLIDAIKTLNTFVDDLNLGFSELDCGFGDLFEDWGEKVCEISYNGLVINMEKRLI